MRKLIIAFIVVSLVLQAQVKPKAWKWIESGTEVQTILLMGDNNIQMREKPEQAFMYVIPTLDQATFRPLNLEGTFERESKD